MLRVALVEDSQEEADALVGHLERYGRARNVRMTVARFSNAMEFIDAGQVFDLVFLDIDLPGINGMELAGLIRTYDTEVAIIFVTNLAQFAVRGYEVNALDFVLKPVSYFNFAMRMDKVARLMRRRSDGHVVIETREQTHVVSFDDLVYVAVSNHKLSCRVSGVEWALGVERVSQGNGSTARGWPLRSHLEQLPGQHELREVISRGKPSFDQR